MKIDISSILHEEGKKIDIDIELSFSDVDFEGVKINTPAHVVGKLSNIGGCLELDADVSLDITYQCDRCLEECNTHLEFKAEERFKKTLDMTDDKNPDIICFSGNEIDLSSTIENVIYMNIPTKLLCTDDCKGLCTMCGKNLNNGECNCDTRVSDPRFDVLDNFFK